MRIPTWVCDWLVARLTARVHHTASDQYIHDSHGNLLMALSGQYVEILPGGVVRTRKSGEIVACRATALHRIVLPHPEDRCVSLFLHGRKVREFGFWHPAAEPE